MVCICLNVEKWNIISNFPLHVQCLSQGSQLCSSLWAHLRGAQQLIHLNSLLYLGGMQLKIPCPFSKTAAVPEPHGALAPCIFALKKTCCVFQCIGVPLRMKAEGVITHLSNGPPPALAPSLVC